MVRTDERGVRVGGTWLRRTLVALLVVLCFGSVLAPASATTVDQRTSPLPNAIGGQRPSSLNERPQGFTAHGFGPLDVVSVDLLLENGSFAPAPPVGPRPHNNRTPIGSRLPPGGMLLQSISAGECRYDQRVDRAHRSGTDVSTHGWWVNLGGTCPAMANVDTYLQAYWCGSYGCRWVTVSSDSRDVRAGGGRGNRGNARMSCSTDRTTGWRSFVDVDLLGVNDPPGFTYSDPQNLSCTPS